MSAFNMNDFYCLKCGKRAYTLPRKICKQHEKFHRKKLYCPWCQTEINCIEIRNDGEYVEFNDLYWQGYFASEIEELRKN